MVGMSHCGIGDLLWRPSTVENLLEYTKQELLKPSGEQKLTENISWK